jgi:hypothetical protein
VDAFVLVESEQDHQDHVKPLWYQEHKERFAPWADKIIPVVTGKMPTKAEDADPWAREHAQREWIGAGLAKLDLVGHDVILQSDVDEIPRALEARNVRPRGFWSFGQLGRFFCVDWHYPFPWFGTVAATVESISRLSGDTPFSYMRDVRMTAQCPPHLMGAGWHFSWLGGAEAALRKVGSFCHPEVEDQIREGLASDRFLRDGIHVDGTRMTPVDVDETWPAFISERRCPANWFRPR